jgi:hypothetical protein
MIVQAFEINRYVNPGDLAMVGIRLADHTFYEGGVTVQKIDGADLILELLGDFPPAAAFEVEAGGMLIKKDSLALCRCHMIITGPVVDGRLRCRILDEVEIHQRREFFRLDVAIPFRWHVPDDQRLTSAIDYWSYSRISLEPGVLPRLAMTAEGGFRVLNWRGESLEPQQINLSGGGIRCRLTTPLAIGTLINLEIFLPLTPGRVIHLVGVVVRSSELVASLQSAVFLTGIRFVHLADTDRETIISFIFNEQRQQLRAFAEER